MPHRIVRRRLIIFFALLIPAGILTAYGINAIVPSLLRSMMHADELQQKSVSRDGQVIATAYYYDTPTYGYYHITLERPPGSKPQDVIEFTSEGFKNLEWKDAKTLRVLYDGTKYKESYENTSFVRRPASWHDVHIEYVPTQD